MRMFPCLALIVALSTPSMLAGGFGGPGPFRNQSPLPTGIDGVYQASARGTNLTGVIGFGIANGIQSSRPNENTYTIFNNGLIIKGNTTVNINGSDVTGILDSDDLTLPIADDGSVDLPVVFIIRGQRAAGEFNGTINLNSPTGNFTGNGRLMPTPEETVQIVGISPPRQINNLAIEGAFTPEELAQITGIVISRTNLVLQGSVGDEVNFRIRGMRKSLRTGAVDSATAAQPPSNP